MITLRINSTGARFDQKYGSTVTTNTFTILHHHMVHSITPALLVILEETLKVLVEFIVEIFKGS